MSKAFLSITLMGAALLIPARGLLAAAEPAARPNVIVVLSDDQGYGDFSCHGNPVLRTPNLDKLHSQSVRLTDFHVAPMCTPTRGQLMTGMDAFHNGASSVSAGRSLVRRGIPTMADIFAGGGYKTALFGKWHLGDSYPNLPHYRGFQETSYHLGWGITSMADTWENDYFDPRFFHNGKLTQYKGYCTDVLFDLGMDWMKERATRREPFFLYLPTNAPHGPTWVADKYKSLYRDKGPAAFFGMIANLDENMGRLESFLTRTGLRDNTLVIFFHDNGGTGGVNVFNAGMRGRKTTYYEGGHRAACFLRWPAGKFGQPRDSDALTEVQDLLPTLIELCGLQTPKSARLDGISLAGLLHGTQPSLPDRMLVVQYGEQPGPKGRKLAKGDCAVLWNKWRLVHGKELYDLRTDPGQMTDVAGKHPEVVRKMLDHYETWWRGVEPGTNDFEPISIGADQENPVKLSSADWARVYCDNMNDLRTGREANGPWHVRVEKDGEYEIALRRWPKEADAPIASGVPAFKAVDGGLPAGKALPITRARIKVGGFDQARDVGPQDKEVVFNVKLTKAEKLPLETWFSTADGKQLCGAYFAYVRRK